jgi:hypothetical protein
MTPEGAIKACVKKFLKGYAVYQWWPVPSGYGISGLDCLVFHNGQCMWIETKAPGEKPTPRQKQFAGIMKGNNVLVVVIDTTDTSTDGYIMVRQWIEWTKP